MAGHVAKHDGPEVHYSAGDEKLFSKVSWKLLPLLTICYLIAFLDRVNIGYAQLQMKQTLPWSDEVYALGAGIFFIGYFLFEVPSNLMLEKIGARATLLRIMFCWGIVAAGMAYVETPTTFYILRFLLGVFEAGFFPGVILYLTYWYPGARRAKAIATFMTGATIAYLIAGPLCGAILKYMNGLGGLHGWQWLFITQGLPASMLGIFAFFYLKNKPEDASWLTADEKARLRHHIEHDAHAVAGASHGSLLALIRDPKIFLLSIIYALALGATYAMVFWAPTLVRSWGVADLFLVGILTAIPALCALIVMVLVGRSSDRHNERRWHYLFCTVLGLAGTAIAALSQGNLILSLFGLAVLSMGQSASTPVFFAAVSEYLPKKTAAGGIALVSSLGNLGPAVMPWITTRINTITGTPAASLYLVGAMWITAGILLMLLIRPAAEAKLLPARA
ncbi:MAG TPA: MFS transporter [Rubrivivax sp.]|nr:MFS transporter [Rubrivivax sp.]